MLNKYFFLFLKGLAMGAVNKIPGVSGGTVAFVTGIYEDLINSIKKINFYSFKILFTRGFKDFFEEIKTALINNEEVKLSGFGNFELIDKKARPGRNPKTGEDVTISARRVVTFRAGNKLRKKISTIDE